MAGLSFDDMVKNVKSNLEKERNKKNVINRLEGNNTQLSAKKWYGAYTDPSKASERNILRFNNPMSQRGRVSEDEIAINSPYNGVWRNEKRRWNTASSAIKSLEYNPMSKDMVIQFQNNKQKYTYPDVPASAVLQWAKSSSKGRAYNKLLKQYSVNYGG